MTVEGTLWLLKGNPILGSKIWETEKVGTTRAEELPLAWTRSRNPASERGSYRKGQKP